jgi:hypothetical protein
LERRGIHEVEAGGGSDEGETGEGEQEEEKDPRICNGREEPELRICLEGK